MEIVSNVLKFAVHFIAIWKILLLHGIFSLPSSNETLDWTVACIAVLKMFETFSMLWTGPLKPRPTYFYILATISFTAVPNYIYTELWIVVKRF